MTKRKNNEQVKIVLIGASTRPLIASCLAGGYVPVAFDFFADWDGKRLIQEAECAGASLTKIERYADLLDYDLASLGDAAILAGGAELRPELVAAVGRQLPLLGAGKNALAAIADPIQWLQVLKETGYRAPESRRVLSVGSEGDWLLKQYGSCGGSGVRAITWETERLTADGLRGACYYQQRIAGESFSAALVSRCQGEGGEDRTFLLGCTRQWLAGDFDVGRSGDHDGRAFAYHGSVGPVPICESVERQIDRIANVLGRQFSLAGVWGLDFILDADGQVWPVDLNPRITASAELFEAAIANSASGFHSVVDLHLSVCDSERGRGGKDFEILISERMVGQNNATCEAKRFLFFDGPGIFKMDQSKFKQLSRLYVRDFFQGSQVGVSIADIPEIGDQIAPGRPLMTMRSRAKTKAEAVVWLNDLLVNVRACLQD